MNDSNNMLYQYTSLEVLALILNNKNLKFSKLSTLDDPLEKYVKSIVSQDQKFVKGRTNLGDFCFVSSWTVDPTESIAMWDMYGDSKRGVRIGLPEDMLDKEYDINKDDNSTKSGLKQLVIIPNTERYLPCPQLIDVDYDRLDTEDPSIHDEKWNLNIEALGKHKLPDWAFQKEKRFRIYANSYNKEGNNPKKHFYVPSESLRNLSINFDHPIEEKYIFFNLYEKALSEIEIVIGPEMSEGDRYLLEALILKYGIDSSKIRKSKFTDPEFIKKIEK